MQIAYATAPDMMGAVGCMGVEIDCKTYVEVSTAQSAAATLE